jgi:hypothetical protein
MAGQFSGSNVYVGWVNGNPYVYDINGNEIFHIDGTTRKLVIAGGAGFSADTAVVAALGTNQGNAAAMTADVNAITGADGTKGVKLPAATGGAAVTVINTDPSNVLNVYPATGGTINSLSANAAFALGPGRSASFNATSTTQWYAPVNTDGTSTVAEQNVLSGVTPGTAAASKALVGDANKAVDVLRTASLRIGASGSEVDKTNVAIGVAAGYKVARGVVAVTNAHSGIETVVTGLATVVAVIATMADDPTVTCESVTASIGDQAGTPAAGSIFVKGWKTLGGTPAAMTTTSVNVNWVAIGT